MTVHLQVLKSKLHRAMVTHADLEYEGSVTIAADLLEAAGILPYEQVHVWNVTRGTRLTTYALRGDVGSGIVCINGAAAHLAAPGDRVIIATFAEVPEERARTWEPTVVLLDEHNRVVDPRAHEVAGPKRRVHGAHA
jgi:aspartate 1-decarboxylase